MASNLGLFCLSHKKDARLVWVKKSNKSNEKKKHEMLRKNCIISRFCIFIALSLLHYKTKMFFFLSNILLRVCLNTITDVKSISEMYLPLKGYLNLDLY